MNSTSGSIAGTDFEVQEIACVSHGVPLCLHIGGAELLAAVPDLLPHATEFVAAPAEDAQDFTLLPPSGRNGYRSFVGEELTREHEEARVVLEQFARDLMVHVANHAPDRVFVHAGVVGWQGSALVIPGCSFAGKTTLVAALLRLGATYYSDEYAVIDAEGTVYPYARALQMRRPGFTEQRGIDARDFGATTGTEPLRVAHVVFTEYAAKAHWNPERVSPGMAALEMLRHAIPVQRTPARVMATLTAMLRGATAWKSPRGEADEAAEAILALFAGEIPS